jgi:hypothetical protein
VRVRGSEERGVGAGVRILELSLTPGKYSSPLFTSHTLSRPVLYGIGTRHIDRY